jgi:hypothetical protein
MKELQGKDISLLECLELMSFKIQHTKDFVNCFESWHNPYGWCQDYNCLQLGPHHKTQDAFNYFSHAYNNKAILDPSN